MTPLISKMAARLVESLEEDVRDGGEIDVRVKFGKFALDSMASCAFGVDARSFAKSGKSEFVQNASNIFRRNAVDMLKVLLTLVPGGRRVMAALGVSIFKTSETLFFYDVVKAAVRARCGGTPLYYLRQSTHTYT